MSERVSAQRRVRGSPFKLNATQLLFSACRFKLNATQLLFSVCRFKLNATQLLFSACLSTARLSTACVQVVGRSSQYTVCYAPINVMPHYPLYGL